MGDMNVHCRSVNVREGGQLCREGEEMCREERSKCKKEADLIF